MLFFFLLAVNSYKDSSSHSSVEIYYKTVGNALGAKHCLYLDYKIPKSISDCAYNCIMT